MRMNPHLTAATLATTLLACTSSAWALEPFMTYDNFSAPTLAPERWADRERSRSIKGGALNLTQRNWGFDGADSGETVGRYNSVLPNPAAVTALKAKITVNALEVNACAANPAVGTSRARIIGGFFNIGSPIPGSQVGDVLALINLIRHSNSADAAGVLRVEGFVLFCTNADCGTSSLIGSRVDLGTVAVGQATTVQLQWDQPAKRFKFSRDAGAFSKSVVYTQTDASPPSVPFKQLSTRLHLPSCQSGPRVAGMIDASFDNIAVNLSAAP